MQSINSNVNPLSIRKHLWWVVPNELAGMPLPWLCDGRLKDPASQLAAFDDDVQFLAETGIKTIIAALELPLHRQVFTNCGFRYFSLKIPDGFPPTDEQAERLLDFYDSCPLPSAAFKRALRRRHRPDRHVTGIDSPGPWFVGRFCYSSC